MNRPIKYKDITATGSYWIYLESLANEEDMAPWGVVMVTVEDDGEKNVLIPGVDAYEETVIEDDMNFYGPLEHPIV